MGGSKSRPRRGVRARVVRAWGVLWSGDVLLPSYCRSARHLAIKAARESWGRAIPLNRIVPVTITFSPPREGGR